MRSAAAWKLYLALGGKMPAPCDFCVGPWPHWRLGYKAISVLCQGHRMALARVQERLGALKRMRGRP